MLLYSRVLFFLMAKCVQAVIEFNSLLRCQMHQFLEILAAMADCWDRICGVRARIEIRFVLLVEVQVGCVSQLNYSKKKIAANKARRCRRRAVQLVVTSSDSRDLTAAMELNESCAYVWQVCKEPFSDRWRKMKQQRGDRATSTNQLMVLQWSVAKWEDANTE